MKTRPLFAWIGALIAAGGVFLFSRNMTILSVRNMDRAASFHFAISPSEEVTLFHTNSVYDARVEEIFQVIEGNMVLKSVKSNSAAVMEYYGFEDTAPSQPLHRNMGPAFSVQTSLRQDQGLRIGGRTLRWRELARAGDRILVSVDQVTSVKFLWWKIFHKDKINPSTER